MALPVAIALGFWSRRLSKRQRARREALREQIEELKGRQLTPAHVARWLVLREQWPAIARAVAREPELLLHLEHRDEERDPELTELLDSEPHLGDLIERLVYFQPAENGGPPS